ncbi:MAG: glutamine-hydrolyzing carbamoyl-phosphate synthase small subunit [Thioalkalivibrionaceae bacterium]
MNPGVVPRQPLQALLVLADGSVFKGRAAGADGTTVGEVVFNTSMTGYQEILTDPSYAGQLVALTYPHIGNVGCNPEDEESDRVHAGGLIVRDVPPLVSSWRSRERLPDYLQRHGIVAIAGIDTRRLTRHLRDRGAQDGAIVTFRDGESADDAISRALDAARSFGGMSGKDLASAVSVDEPVEWLEGVWRLGEEPFRVDPGSACFHVVAYDFGIKRNILRLLAERNCRVTRVPAKTPFADVLALEPDGLFFSNGPGDPEPCDYAIEALQSACKQGLPVFGICLGHQLLGIASGGRTEKMPTGHHGANHPVREAATGRVSITSQNHGFAVAADALPDCLEATHVSLFDGTLQGLKRRDCPAFSVQGHPEASPGPHDAQGLFDDFVAAMESARN